ncbi:MAG TPA: HNH endonuclease [Candidatus Udaeobacter sp.]|nr:HNH endonuclease [Candidatus Udaeobacter sp.]
MRRARRRRGGAVGVERQRAPGGTTNIMLNERALVLNRHWLAVDTVSVRRALCMLYLDVARAVSPETFELHDWSSWTSLRVEDGQPRVQAVRFQMRVPEIILLLVYDRIPRKRVIFSRRNLFRRDRFTCQYCGRQPGKGELSIDHIVPRSLGGRSSWVNCVVACLKCNKRKADRTLQQAGLTLLVTPREPSWSPYLSLNLGRRRVSWERFISEKYWNVELEA